MSTPHDQPPLAGSTGSARFSETEDGSHLLHVVDGDMEILVEIWTAGVSVVLSHNGACRLMDFETPNSYSARKAPQ